MGDRTVAASGPCAPVAGSPFELVELTGEALAARAAADEEARLRSRAGCERLEALEAERLETLRVSKAGRTIRGVEIHHGESGPETVELTLDDGRHIEIRGWGHDWWGVNFEERR